MATKREAILVRLLALMGEVTGINTLKRNEGLQQNEKRDCIVLLDGDESDISPSSSNGRTGLMRPQKTRMTPQVFIVLKEQRPVNQGDDPPTNVGTLLNVKRDAVIKAISNDPQLATLVGSNGKATLLATATDLREGGGLSGSMRLDFAFEYWIIPSAI